MMKILFRSRRALWTALPLSLLGLSTPAWSAAESEDIALLKAQVAELTERLAELEASRSRTEIAVENLNQQVAAAPPPAASDWASRISLKGDLRYRHEWIDVDGSPDRHRHRIRARLGTSARVLDNLNTHIQFATGSSDPRSTNQTLGGNFSTKSIGLDLAYFDWGATESLNVLGGKMKNPVQRPRGSRFIDGDITPEGLAAVWGDGSFFVQGAGYWAVERSRDDDTYALIAQGGYRGEPADGVRLTAAVSYTDWFNARGFAPFFEDDPFGNSIDASGNLLYDYDLVEAYAELGLQVADRPLVFYAQYGVNTEADDEDTAWSTGVTLGRASAPGTWQVGYAYHDHEKDALFAQVVDSDFAGGQTDARGHVITGSYALSKAVGLNLTYFHNEFDVSTPDEQDYRRLQLDLNIRY